MHIMRTRLQKHALRVALVYHNVLWVAKVVSELDFEIPFAIYSQDRDLLALAALFPADKLSCENKL